MKFLSKEEVIIETITQRKHLMSENEITFEEKKNLGRVIEESSFFDGAEELKPDPQPTLLKSLALPSAIDLRQYDTQDKDEQDNGKCTAWALTSCMENMLNRHEKIKPVDLSEWHAWNFYRQYSCASAIRALSAGNLICDDKFYPQYSKPKSGIDENKHATILRHKYLGNDCTAMCEALSRGKVIYLGMKTPRDMLQGRAVISPNSAMSPGGHALAIVGYYIDQRVPGSIIAIIRNSWGNKIGDLGYQYLPIAHYASRPDCYIMMWSIEEVASTKLGHVAIPRQKTCVAWKRVWYKPWQKTCIRYEYK